MRKVLIFIILYVLAIFSLTAPLTAQAADKVVVRIEITGIKVVSEATAISKIKIRSGQVYNENIINDDVRNLYATGFFETVVAEKETTPEGIVITFKVKEKKVVKEISISGAKRISKRKIKKRIEVAVKAGVFIDENKLKDASNKIKDLYIQKGFANAKVQYEMESLDDDNVKVKFLIEEKKVIKVRKVIVEGNSYPTDNKIRKIMKSKPAWLFNRGYFKEDVLSEDKKNILDYYTFKGFSDAKVSIDVSYIKKGAVLTIRIEEGMRYFIGNVEIEGYENIAGKELKEALKLGDGNIYTEDNVYDGITRMREVYMDDGYIFSDIKSATQFNPETKKVDVKYTIVENHIAYINKIIVRGNVKTKDKVVRREMRVYPHERFDGKKIRRSKERLERLGFFEEMRFGTEPTNEPDFVDLIIDVKEARTGTLSFGGGYSSVDKFTAFIELSQKNFDFLSPSLTGAGQDLSLYISSGSVSEEYNLSFTNPWIFDKPYTFGFDFYKTGHDREGFTGYAYEESIVGGDLRLGREFNEYFRTDLTYKYDRVKIRDVIEQASQSLKDEEGTNRLSSGLVGFSFDTRDSVFSPRNGVLISEISQLTGGVFQGDKDFFKQILSLSFFVPAFEDAAIEFKTKFGFARPFGSTQRVPIYERFYTGGARTIRGYRERTIGPRDEQTGDAIGGESTFTGKIEYVKKLEEFIKLVLFYDTGNTWPAYKDFFSTKLYSSVGTGFRLNTPLGPINLDYGWPLQLEPGRSKKRGRFHFSISRGF